MANKSVVIPHVPLNEKLNSMLDNCQYSIKGQYDELILVINNGIGYAKAFNQGFKFSSGEFILGISNDTVLTNGNLNMLCDSQAVTFTQNAQFGCFFCMPRWVFQQTQGFDEEYGLAYWEDEDFLLRLEDRQIPLKRVPGVLVDHIGGATVKALDKEKEASNFGAEVFLKKWGNRRAIIPE